MTITEQCIREIVREEIAAARRTQAERAMDAARIVLANRLQVPQDSGSTSEDGGEHAL